MSLKPEAGRKGPINRVSAQSRNQLKALFGSNVWVNLIYLATFLVMGGLLNSVEFGTFRVAQAYLSVAVSIAMLGLNTAVTHQFPLFTPDQKARAWVLARRIVVITSICVGLIVYGLVPSVQQSPSPLQELLYLLCFPVAVVGASLCNLLLSAYQARGDLNGYARLQAQWKTTVFVFGLAGGALLQAQTVLIAMAMAYAGVYLLQYRNTLAVDRAVEPGNTPLTGFVRPLFRSGIWPFASICVSAIYANIEFLYVDSGDLSSGVAGAYSLASLIFIGGAAFFMPLQTYAGSLVVNRRIGLVGLLKLQCICLAAVCLTALAALGLAYGLNHVLPQKFNSVFLDFAGLVSIKLGLWGSYAVVGSVLNYLDKGLESFLLTVICLMGLGLGSLLIGGVDSLREMVVLQIASGVVLLGGSMYLVVVGFRGRPIKRMVDNEHLER
ncbi:MAG: lipopolysaccharide biosynthesis protein [Curvibacter sp.]